MLRLTLASVLNNGVSTNRNVDAHRKNYPKLPFLDFHAKNRRER